MRGHSKANCWLPRQLADLAIRKNLQKNYAIYRHHREIQVFKRKTEAQIAYSRKLTEEMANIKKQMVLPDEDMSQVWYLRTLPNLNL